MIEYFLALVLAVWLGPAVLMPAGPLSERHHDLDRITFAVEGAESSHGRNPAMWRQDPRGPQGPMQITHAAALDVGGGNRFDLQENGQLGRAYLALMFQRYGNWVDAVAAYNWGPGNLDRWISAGRPATGISIPIRAYVGRVMREFTAATAPGATASQPEPVAVPSKPDIKAKPDIKDGVLRKKYERNDLAIGKLRSFIEHADDSADNATIALMRSVSARPGYTQFANFRAGGPRSGTGLRQAAAILMQKLQAENAAIALIDERRRKAP